jgi:hypothetical protein
VGKIEAVRRPVERSHRKIASAVAVLVTVIAVGVFATRFILKERRARDERDGHLIAVCARDAEVLDRVSRLAWSTLYPDTDHFLGKEPRPFEDETLHAIVEARRVATKSAGELPATMPRSQDAAREMYVTAAQEAQLAGEPRGNWLSFMSETTRARSDFERAKLRYQTAQNKVIEHDYNEDSVAVAFSTALAPITYAAKEQQRLLAEKAEKEQEARSAEIDKEAAESVDRTLANARVCKVTFLKWTDLKSLDLVEGEVMNLGTDDVRDVDVEIRFVDAGGKERSRVEKVTGVIPPHGKKEFVTSVLGTNSHYRAQLLAGGTAWESGYYKRLGER